MLVKRNPVVFRAADACTHRALHFLLAPVEYSAQATAEVCLCTSSKMKQETRNHAVIWVLSGETSMRFVQIGASLDVTHHKHWHVVITLGVKREMI